jgi:invasion protein IalB
MRPPHLRPHLLRSIRWAAILPALWMAAATAPGKAHPAGADAPRLIAERPYRTVPDPPAIKPAPKAVKTPAKKAVKAPEKKAVKAPEKKAVKAPEKKAVKAPEKKTTKKAVKKAAKSTPAPKQTPIPVSKPASKATSTPAYKPASTQASTPRAGTGGGWTLTCANLSAARPNACRVYFSVRTRKSRQLILAVLVHQQDAKAAPTMTFRTPFGVYLPAGVRYVLDKTKAIQVAYLSCTQQGCFAPVPLSKDVLTRMKGGQRMTVVMQNMKRQDIKIIFTLAGFDAAYRKLVAK